MDALSEFKRLTLHRQIIKGKLSIPSNEATRAVLTEHLQRIDQGMRRLFPVERDPWQAEQTLKNRRSKDRARLREARLWRNDDYAETVKARIERLGERIADCREEQTAEITGEKPVRLPDPTVEGCKAGILVAIKYNWIECKRAQARGDVGGAQVIAARMRRLERMIAALPGVPI